MEWQCLLISGCNFLHKPRDHTGHHTSRAAFSLARLKHQGKGPGFYKAYFPHPAQHSSDLCLAFQGLNRNEDSSPNV